MATSRVHNERPRDDERWLCHALGLASRARGRTAPNPLVGAVVVRGGRMVGEGFHERAGCAHAEPMALRRAGARARGATLYVTLEPCHHTGRTGPCTEAILQAGIRRVVVGTGDNDPRVRGRGLRFLRQHGVDVRLGVMRVACRRLNAPYHFAKTHQFAWAAGLWHRGADPSAIGALRHSLRDAFDVVAVSVTALRAADATLRCRRPGGRDPARLVIDPWARLSPRAALLQAAALRRAPTFVACRTAAPSQRQQALAAAGATLLPMGDGTRRTMLRAALQGICAHGRHSVLVDSDPALLGALARARLLQRLWGGAAALREPMAAGSGMPMAVRADWQRTIGDAVVWAGTPLSV